MKPVDDVITAVQDDARWGIAHEVKTELLMRVYKNVKEPLDSFSWEWVCVIEGQMEDPK